MRKPTYRYERTEYWYVLRVLAILGDTKLPSSIGHFSWWAGHFRNRNLGPNLVPNVT